MSIETKALALIIQNQTIMLNALADLLRDAGENEHAQLVLETVKTLSAAVEALSDV